jgi:hypothetical protein
VPPVGANAEEVGDGSSEQVIGQIATAVENRFSNVGLCQSLYKKRCQVIRFLIIEASYSLETWFLERSQVGMVPVSLLLRKTLKHHHSKGTKS